MNRGDQQAAVRRTVTIHRDIDDAVLASVDAREYSLLVNSVLVMALQM